MTLSEHATGMTFAVLPCTEGPAAPDFELPSQSVVNLENIPSCSKYLYESACVGTQNGRPDSHSPGTDTLSYTPIEGTGTPY